MSDPILYLAEQILDSPTRDGSPQEKLAERLLDEHKRGVWLSEQYQALHGKYNAACHELDRFREQQTVTPHQTRLEPRHAIYCLNTGCSASIIRDALPPDDAMEAWLRGLGWSAEGYCERCKA